MQVFLLNDGNGETLGVFDSMSKAVLFASQEIADNCFADGFKASEIEKESRIKTKETKTGCTIDSAYGEYFVIGHYVR